MTQGPLDNLVVRSEQGDIQLIEKISSHWCSLNEEGPCCEPFYRPEWIAAYLRAFAPASKLVLITAWKNENLRGVLPLVTDSTSLCGINFKTLRSASNIHNCRFDLIHGSTDKELVTKSIWNHLESRKDWNILKLQDVAEDAAFNQCTLLAQQKHYYTSKVESVNSPYLEISSSIDTQKNGKQYRSRLSKKKQKLESLLGPIVLEKIPTYDSNLLNNFYEMEGSGWKSQAKTAIKFSSDTLQFYSEVAMNAAQYGYLSMYRLKAGEETIAIHLGLTMGGCYFMPKVAYDEKYAEFSPGQILVREIIKESEQSGFKRVDFLGTTSQWKSVWTNRSRKHSTHYILRNNVQGLVFYTIKFRIREFLGRIKRSFKKNNSS